MLALPSELCRSPWGKLLVVVIGVVAHFAGAQEPLFVVNPNRPTFATPALTTQLGVAEMEFGPQQSFLWDESTAFSTPTLVKLGLAKDFELRVSTNGLLHLTHPGISAATGLTDFSLGAHGTASKRDVCSCATLPLRLDSAVRAANPGGAMAEIEGTKGQTRSLSGVDGGVKERRSR